MVEPASNPAMLKRAIARPITASPHYRSKFKELNKELSAIELDERHLIAAILYYRDHINELKQKRTVDEPLDKLKEEHEAEASLVFFQKRLAEKIKEITQEIEENKKTATGSTLTPNQQSQLSTFVKTVGDKVEEDGFLLKANQELLEKLIEILGKDPQAELDFSKLEDSEMVKKIVAAIEKREEQEEKISEGKEIAASIGDLIGVLMDNTSGPAGAGDTAKSIADALKNIAPSGAPEVNYGSTVPVVSQLFQAGLQIFDLIKTARDQYVLKKADVIQPRLNIGLAGATASLLIGGAIVGGLALGSVGLLGTVAATIALPIVLPLIPLIATVVSMARNLAGYKKTQSRIEKLEQELPQKRLECDKALNQAIGDSLNGPNGLIASEKDKMLKTCYELVEKLNTEILALQKNPQLSIVEKEHFDSLVKRRNHLIDIAGLSELKNKVAENQGLKVAVTHLVEAKKRIEGLKNSLVNYKKQIRIFSPIAIILAAAGVAAGVCFIVFPPAVIPILVVAAVVGIATAVVAILDKKYKFLDKLFHKDKPVAASAEDTMDHKAEVAQDIDRQMRIQAVREAGVRGVVHKDITHEQGIEHSAKPMPSISSVLPQSIATSHQTPEPTAAIAAAATSTALAAAAVGAEIKAASGNSGTAKMMSTLVSNQESHTENPLAQQASKDVSTTPAIAAKAAEEARKAREPASIVAANGPEAKQKSTPNIPELNLSGIQPTPQPELQRKAMAPASHLTPEAEAGFVPKRK